MTSVDGVKIAPKRQFDVRARQMFGRRLLMRVHVTMETNDTGFFIWSQCDGTKPVAEIAAAVAAEFKIDPVTAAADVEDFIASLADSKFISWERT